MVIVENRHPVIETFEEGKLDISLFKKKGNSKTYKGYLIQKMKEARDMGNFELVAVIQHFYQKYVEMEEKISIDSWRGKGKGIKVWKTPTGVMVEFTGPRDKDDKPNVQRKEYSKGEINKLIMCINKLKDQYNNKIPSRYLGEEYFGGSWDLKVFSQRSDHMKFTHILNILDYYKVIKYSRAGFTTVLNEVKEIQEVLR